MKEQREIVDLIGRLDDMNQEKWQLKWQREVSKLVYLWQHAGRAARMPHGGYMNDFSRKRAARWLAEEIVELD